MKKLLLGFLLLLAVPATASLIQAGGMTYELSLPALSERVSGLEKIILYQAEANKEAMQIAAATAAAKVVREAEDRFATRTQMNIVETKIVELKKVVDGHEAQTQLQWWFLIGGAVVATIAISILALIARSYKM